MKANETATYKAKKDSRKADRGKVLVFGKFQTTKIFGALFLFVFFEGTEEECVDQLQILQEDLFNEN